MLQAMDSTTVYAASKDNAGDDETPVGESFKIDRTPPTLTCAAHGAGVRARLGRRPGRRFGQ